MTQRISINPNPPRAGQQATVSYNFTGTTLAEVRLEITYSTTTPPDPEPAIITLKPQSNSKTITLPDDAEQITITDMDGESPDLVLACLPLQIEGMAEG